VIPTNCGRITDRRDQILVGIFKDRAVDAEIVLEKAVCDNKENQFVGFDQKDTSNTISASTARSLKIPTKI
jgi:hypothetical protein